MAAATRTAPSSADPSGHRLTGETTIAEDSMDHHRLQQRFRRGGMNAGATQSKAQS